LTILLPSIFIYSASVFKFSLKGDFEIFKSEGWDTVSSGEASISSSFEYEQVTFPWMFGWKEILPH